MLDPRYLQVDLILSSEFNVAVLMVLIPRFPTQIFSHVSLTRDWRRIKSRAIRAPVLCLLEQMGKFSLSKPQ